MDRVQRRADGRRFLSHREAYIELIDIITDVENALGVVEHG